MKIQVSSGEGEIENIVIVDEDDNLIGEEEKEKCHEGDGILHRGFLVMVFNGTGELLLTRRSKEKTLWPGCWDGTVASHVWRGEDYVQASKRRLVQEIGLKRDNIKYLFKFRYHVRYKDIGAENEICAVTMVDCIDAGGIFVNNKEISAVRVVTPKELMKDIRKNGNIYTPWLSLAMDHMDRRRLL